jgi:hypothetical protein
MKGYGEFGEAKALIDINIMSTFAQVRFSYRGAMPIETAVEQGRENVVGFVVQDVPEGREIDDLRISLPVDVVLAIGRATSDYGDDEWKVRYDEAQKTLGFVREQLERQHIRVDEILRAFLSGPR